jgi:cytochrome b
VDDVATTRSKLFWFVLAVLSFWLLVLPAANAYVDPGTGSYIFQVVIGVFLGAAVALKVFWRRIWGFVTRKPARTTASPPAPREQED